MAWDIPSTLRPVHVLQNNAIRSLCGIGNWDLVRSMYSMINIMPAARLRDFYTLVFMYKYHYGCVPECFTGIFRDRSNIHDHRTRTSGDIEVPHLVSRRTAFSIIYRGAKLWNKLVPSIKELPINQFNAVLRVGFW